MLQKPAREGIDPDLLEAWLRARSVARGVPQPVHDAGGLRVDTGLPNELRRYVFAAHCDGLTALGQTIRKPGIYLKLCDTAEALAVALPACWHLQPLAYLMTCDRWSEPARIPDGYGIESHADGAVTQVVVRSNDGTVAASGYAAEYADIFVYDRIVTDPAHQRLGLGRAVMAALGQARRSAAPRQMLAATEMGRGLYTALGWTVRSPFATAFIPEISRP